MPSDRCNAFTGKEKSAAVQNIIKTGNIFMQLEQHWELPPQTMDHLEALRFHCTFPKWHLKKLMSFASTCSVGEKVKSKVTSYACKDCPKKGQDELSSWDHVLNKILSHQLDTKSSWHRHMSEIKPRVREIDVTQYPVYEEDYVFDSEEDD